MLRPASEGGIRPDRPNPAEPDPVSSPVAEGPPEIFFADGDETQFLQVEVGPESVTMLDDLSQHITHPEQMPQYTEHHHSALSPRYTLRKNNKHRQDSEVQATPHSGLGLRREMTVKCGRHKTHNFHQHRQHKTHQAHR